MKFYFTTTFLGFASAANLKGSYKGNQSSLKGGQCGELPCLPGLDAMGTGYDIVKGNSDRLQQIIEFNYDSPSVYVNPFDKTLTYNTPAEAIAKDNTSGQESVTSKTYTSSSTYASEKATSAGVGVTIGAFSADVSVTTMKSTLEASADYGSVVQSDLLVTLYDITLAPGPLLALTDFFKQFVDTLPKTYESVDDKEKYLQFIRYYGTHYVSAATFGGAGSMSTAVNREYQMSSSNQAVASQASAHFAWVKAGGSSSSETDESEESFRSGSVFTTNVVGGDPTSLEDWDAWEKTFYQAPAMIQYTLHKLSELVTVVDASVAENIDRAVEDYAGGAAELCQAESDSIVKLNDQVATLSGKSCCFHYDFEGSQGQYPYLGYSCMTSNVAGTVEIPRFTSGDNSYAFTTEEECKASSKCGGC